MNSRKGAIPLLIPAALLVGLLLVIGTNYMPVADFFAGGVTVNGCLAAEPNYGRFACEPLKSVAVPKSTSISAQDMRTWNSLNMITCGDTENSPSCSAFTVNCNSNKFVFQSSTAQSCLIGSSNWCEVGVNKGTETSIATSLKIGEKIKMGGCLDKPYYAGNLCLGCTWQSGTAYEYFIPYALNQYSSNGLLAQQATTSCDLTDSSKVVTNCGGDSQCQKAFSGSTRLDWDSWVNYVDGYDTLLELDKRLVTYNGQQAYCTPVAGGAQIYSFTKVTTAGGSCYSLPSSQIATKDCCPGAETANSLCGNDFTWHAKITYTQNCGEGYTKVGDQCVLKAQCYTSFDCTGQGNYVRDYSVNTPTVVKYGCVAGQCVLQDKKAVQCTTPDYGCQSGDVCNPSSFTCEAQKGVELKCGDGVCTKPYEDNYNCPADCKAEAERKLGDYLGILTKAMIIAALITMGLWTIINFVIPVIPILLPVNMLLLKFTGGWLKRPQFWFLLFALLTGAFIVAVI